MAWAATAIVGGSLLSSYMGGQATSGAADAAARSQLEAAKLQIAESGRQFDVTQANIEKQRQQQQALMQPYTAAGTSAMTAQLDMLGLNGPEAQAAAISGISSSPEMQAMQTQGENAILQNASATGGLRGGNTQAALAQFRPQLLNQLIGQRFSNLGGISSLGQNAAAGVGNTGMQLTNAGIQAGQANSTNIQNALGQMGAAQAGSALAAGNATANMWANAGNTATTLGTLHLLGRF